MNRDTLTWTVRAFALTLLVLLVAMLVAHPLSGWAQSNGTNSGGSHSNQEAMVPGEADASGSASEGQMLDEAGYGSPLVVPASDFSSDGNDPDGFYFDFAGGYVNGNGTACLKAPAYLPAGAAVTSVYASIYDNAAGNVMVNLRRVNVSSGSSDAMASFGTESDSTAIQQRGDTVINYPEVIHPDYAYYLTTCLNYADHRLYSVRIYYTGP